MLDRMVTRRAAEVRALLDRGGFDGIRVPLRNGGSLPAAMYADIALRDLHYLSSVDPGGDSQEVVNSRRLAEDVELLHAVVLAPTFTPVLNVQSA